MNINIGDRIQELREQQKMSQEKLAELLGVSRQAISKWERHEALPDLYNLQKISEEFHISLDELVKGTRSNSTYQYNASRKFEKVDSSIMRKANNFIIFGVCLIILSAMAFVAVAVIFNTDVNLSFLLMSLGILISISTGIMVRSEFYKQKHKIIKYNIADDFGIEIYNKYNWTIIAGIAIIINGCFIFVSSVLYLEAIDALTNIYLGIGLGILGILITLSVGMFIYSDNYKQELIRYSNNKAANIFNNNFSDDNGYEEEESKWAGFISIFATIAYLYLGFFLGLWHPGWIVFLIIPLGIAIEAVVKSNR